MRNPLAHLVHRNPDKPTLRERAAALKATASRVMRKKPAAAEGAPSSLGAGLSDPILAPIAEAYLLLRRNDEMFAAHERPGSGISWGDASEAGDALTEHCDNVLMQSAPTTPEGAVALARFAVDWFESQGVALARDEHGASILRLIAAPSEHSEPAGRIHNLDTTPLEPLMARWREAAKVAGADVDDDEGTRLADIMTAAEHEIIRAQVASVRDLACKIELLGTYRGVHDLDYGPPKLLLDAICNDIEALVRAEAAKERAAGPHEGIVEDAELLALGREFDAIHAEWTLAVRAGRRAEKQVSALSAELRGRRGWTWQEAHEVAWAQPGVSEASDAQEALSARMEKVGNLIRALPARTIDGLAVKARVVIPAVWMNGHYEEDAGLSGDEDWVELNARSLIDECLSLAGVDWTGRRIRAAARAPEGPSNITPKASASEIDLSGLGISDLCAFYETMKAARALWSGAMCEPPSTAKVYPSGWVDLTPFGERADFEDSRIGFLMDRVASEAAGRSPADRCERDSVLALRIEQEIACEGRIRDTALLADITQAWG